MTRMIWLTLVLASTWSSQTTAVGLGGGRGLSQQSLAGEYEQLLAGIPALLEAARLEIIHHTASNNMLGYTRAAGFLMGASLDTLAQILFENKTYSESQGVNETHSERHTGDPADDKHIHWARWFGLFGFNWFGAVSLSWSSFFPGTFRAAGRGSPHLACSSADLLALLAEHGVTTDITSITDRPPGPRAVMLERLRRDFTVRLDCVVGRAGEFRSAARVATAWQHLLGLVELHQQLGVTQPGPGPADLTALDTELQQLWTDLPATVASVQSRLVTRRVRDNVLVVLKTILSLLGTISHMVLQAASVKEGDAVEAGPAGETGIPQPQPQQGGAEEEETKPVKLGEALLVTAPLFWGFGYAGFGLVFYMPVYSECGVGVATAVQARHTGLGSVRDLLAGGNTRLEVEYMLNSWRRELDLALHCLLTTKDGAELRSHLDMFGSLVKTRLNVRS